MKKTLCILVCVLMLCSIMLTVGCKKDKDDLPEEPVVEIPTSANIEYVLERQGSPSTGYQWFVSVDDTSVLKAEIRTGEDVPESSVSIGKSSSESTSIEKDIIIGVSQFLNNGSTNESVGESYTYQIVLTPQKAGETIVRLDYKRAWEETFFDFHEAYKATVSEKDGNLVIDLDYYYDLGETPSETSAPEPTAEPITEEDNGDRLYCVYSMISEGMEIDLPLMALVGIDPMGMYILLHEDGTGEMCFKAGEDSDGQPIEIKWTETEIVAGDDSVTYEIDEVGHMTITIENEKMVFAPAAEVEAALTNVPEGD